MIFNKTNVPAWIDLIVIYIALQTLLQMKFIFIAIDCKRQNLSLPNNSRYVHFLYTYIMISDMSDDVEIRFHYYKVTPIFF